MFVKKQTTFSTFFFARAKNGRFLSRAPFLVTRKKMREKKLLCF
jgi:hypothetical protein